MSGKPHRLPADVSPDRHRRKVLLATTSIAFGAGAAALSVPFIASFLPTERARVLGGPIEADLGPVRPGQIVTVEWRGRPVWILRRTTGMLDQLEKHADRLRDPNSDQPQQPAYCRNATRSVKPEFLVAVGLCTHLQCIPNFAPNPGGVDPDWQGGFFCPCHGSKFDFAGRVFKNVPAPKNLVIPPHAYLGENRVLIGHETV